MKRWNDFRAHTGDSFVSEFDSYFLPVPHEQVSDPPDVRLTQHHDDVLQFALDLSQKGLLRGDYKLLEAARLDLPTKAPPPEATVWLKMLPDAAQVTLSPESISVFLESNFHQRDQSTNYPVARVHCAHPSEYARVLERLTCSDMIEWSLIRAEETKYSKVADLLTMTSFAVVKDDDKDRFISWPRIQNSQFFEPPLTKLPHPGHFSRIREDHRFSLSGFYLDGENMFHNIRLPQHLVALFPLQKIAYGNLTGKVQRCIAERLGFRPGQYEPVRPLQATLPMGFKWAVFIAHNFLQACYEKALQTFFKSSKTFGVTRPIPPVVRLHECLGTPLSSGCVLILHIIDDLNFVLSDWPTSEATLLQRIVEEEMARSYLPVKRSKSSPRGVIETVSLPFIGWAWDLKNGLIRPKSAKLLAAAKAAAKIAQGSFSDEDLRSAVGRLIWVLLGARPLLSVLYRTFQLIQQPRSTSGALKTAVQREILMSVTLSCLSQIRTRRNTWQRIIAFDACEYGGAVVYTDTSYDWIQTLTKCSFNTHGTSTETIVCVTDNHRESVYEFTRAHVWKTAFIHHWRRPQHINALEAQTGVLAVQWAISNGISGNRIILLSDSLVAIGAFRKGRSSSSMLCLPCRKLAALITAHDLDVNFVHVPSEINPADGPSRVKPVAART